MKEFYIKKKAFDSNKKDIKSILSDGLSKGFSYELNNLLVQTVNPVCIQSLHK